MSNGTPNPNTGIHHPAVIIAQMFFQFLTLCLTLYISTLANKNEEKIAEVQQVQKENTTRQEEVKQTLDVKTEKDYAATKIQLWNTWKNLEWVAEQSGLPVDIAKAEEAKRIYEQFRDNNK